MRIAIGTAAAIAILTTVAYAAVDIPTRYSGSFPSSGLFRNVSGNFTGASLALKYTYVRSGSLVPMRGSYSCKSTGTSQSSCSGSFRSDDGRLAGRGVVTVTWSAGRPTAIGFCDRHSI